MTPPQQEVGEKCGLGTLEPLHRWSGRSQLGSITIGFRIAYDGYCPDPFDENNTMPSTDLNFGTGLARRTIWSGRCRRRSCGRG